jgi:hypothetical protein
MAHYAIIDENNLVIQVFIGRDENDLDETGIDWETKYSTPGVICKRTSFNTRGGVHYDPDTGKPSSNQSKAIRKNYAGIGFTYDQERDAFIPPKPFESWTLNSTTCLWDAPVKMPKTGGPYIWDEESLSWVAVPAE